ncbi:hypothetical protein [Psychrobacter sp. AOP29-E1-4]|uniref:hypothetical protein n=3 Tax=Psychrobacter TaxID=497 RepID=UPI0040370D54
MKNWQAIALCLSIIVSVAASAFYLKYEPKTLVATNFGTVDLGKVFAEKVMIDIVLIDHSGNEESFVDGINFYNSSRPIVNALVELNNRRNSSGVESKYQTSYSKLNASRANKEKLKIRTYITYHSSNFKNIPYTLLLGEETHSLKSYAPLRDSIYEIVDSSFETKKEQIASNLFMTRVCIEFKSGATR